MQTSKYCLSARSRLVKKDVLCINDIDNMQFYDNLIYIIIVFRCCSVREVNREFGTYFK